VPTEWERSNGIQADSDIYFLSFYSLYCPGKVIIPFVIHRVRSQMRWVVNGGRTQRLCPLLIAARGLQHLVLPAFDIPSSDLREFLFAEIFVKTIADLSVSLADFRER
jgi:hypothetical protein